MTNKTPFELRYEALVLAKNHLDGLYNSKVNRAMQNPDAYLRYKEVNALDSDYATSKDILELAKLFDNFIKGSK